MPDNKRQHFVPQHYLRQFCVDESQQVAIATVAPFKFIGLGAINRQCQEDYFYGKDEPWENLLTATETAVDPALKRVTSTKELCAADLGALQLMTAILHNRTRKEVEAAKVAPRYMVKKIIEGAIKRGELPPCPDGEVSEEMWDFKGVPGFQIHMAGLCLMEMHTLGCKLLESSPETYFISSDNPVVRLNQFCIGADPYQDFAGFGKSGFQLLLPISPNLCLFFYDENTYKVGNRRDKLVAVSKQDMEIINSFQVQSAEKCLYFHRLKLEHEIQKLVSQYTNLRVSTKDLLRVIPLNKTNQEFIHARHPSVKLPTAWSFCHRRKHIKSRPGDLRKPAWSALGEEFMKEVEESPNGEDIFTRLKKFHKKIVDDFDQSNEAKQ